MINVVSNNLSTSNQYIKYRIIVTETDVSIPLNRSTVTVEVQAWRTNNYTTYGTGTCYCTVNGTTYSQSISSSQHIYYNSYTTIFHAHGIDIPHNADGKKTIYVSAYINHQKFSSSSQGFNLDLTTIPRKATLTDAPAFTGNPTISYVNNAGDVVDTLEACISLDGETAFTSWYSVPKLDFSYQIPLSFGDALNLRNKTESTVQVQVYIILKTVISGVTYTDSIESLYYVANPIKPTFTSVSYKDIDGTVTAITQDSQLIVQNKSYLAFDVNLKSSNPAKLASLTININGVTVTESLSGTSVLRTVNFGNVGVSQDTDAILTLTDSRGVTNTMTVPITVAAWSPPTAIINCARQQNYYSNTDLYVNADYASIAGQNTVTITYYYKRTDTGTWTLGGTMADESTVTMTLDNTHEWNIKVEIADAFQTTTYLLNIDKGIPIFFADRLRRSVGINCFPDEDNILAVNDMNATAILGNNEKALTATFINTDTFVIELPFEVDANNRASGVLFAPGALMLLDLSSSPTVTNVVGPAATITLDADDKTFTITAGSTIQGVTTINVGLYNT